ncbi:outer membrane protein W [compost metagenome]
MQYDNAFGLATQLGVDISISKNLFVNLDVKHILLKTDVNVDASNLATGLNIPAKVNINPFLLGFGVGVKF